MEYRINTQVRNRAVSFWLMRRYRKLCRSLERKSRWLRLPGIEVGLYAYTMYSGGVYLTLRFGRRGRKEHPFDVLLLGQMDWACQEPGLSAKLSASFSRWGVIMSHWNKGLTREQRRAIKVERNVPFTP